MRERCRLGRGASPGGSCSRPEIKTIRAGGKAMATIGREMQISEQNQYPGRKGYTGKQFAYRRDLLRREDKNELLEL